MSRTNRNPITMSKPLKAVLDARRVPFDLFGRGHAAHLRKLIFMYLATWADPDGTEAYPALATIATDCGVTVRGLSNVLGWLSDHGLVAIQSKASHLGTNKYSVLLTQDALEAARQKIDIDQDQLKLRAKTESTRKARSDAAKVRWAKTRASADMEHSVLGEQAEDVECSVPGGHGTDCIAHGTGCMQHGTLRSNDRPLDRPLDRERDRRKAANTVATATSTLPSAANAAKETDTDYQWIGVQMAINSWPIAPQAERIIRTYLKEGQSKEHIFNAIRSTFDGMPDAERQPGLYLGQNLRANFDLLLTRGREHNNNNNVFKRRALEDTYPELEDPF